MKKYAIKFLTFALSVSLLTGFAVPVSAATSKQIKVFNVSIASEPDTIDPGMVQTSDGNTYITHMFEGLTNIDKDENCVPGVAKTWSKSADGLTWTFNLRDNAKWSDGKVVTASDFVYAWQRAVDPKTASPYQNFMFFLKNGQEIGDGKMSIDKLGVVAKDPTTLVVTLAAPCAFFPNLVQNSTFYPVRKDVVDAKGAKWSQDPKTYISNGPYKLTSWEHNSKLVMVRNHDYWNDKNITGPEKINWYLLNTPESHLVSYKTNKIQYDTGFPSTEIPNLQKSGDYHAFVNLGTNYMDLNNQKEPFNNPKVREAIYLAIDRQYIADKVIMSGQKIAAAYVPPKLLQPDGKEFRTVGDTQNKYTDVSNMAANIKRAQQLLAEAGYPGGKGFPEFNYNTNSAAANVNTAQAIQSDLKNNLGISMKVNVGDWKVLVAQRNAGDYLASRDAWSGDYLDPSTFLTMFMTGDGNNNAKYSNPKFDSLVKAALKEPNDTKRMNLYHQAENLLINVDHGIVPLTYRNTIAAYKSNLEGVLVTVTGHPCFYWTTQK